MTPKVISLMVPWFIASDRYWPMNNFYCHSTCRLLYYIREPEAFPDGMRTGNIFGLMCSECQNAQRLGLPMNQARYNKLVVDIDVCESAYASTDQFPSCKISYPVGIGVSNNGNRIQEQSVMNSKSGSRLQVSKYSLCWRCIHFERLNIVLAESSDTKDDIWLTSECRIHE